MNTQTQEALKMAIEALAEFEWIKDSKYKKAIQACKEALAHQAPKNCTPLDEYIAEMEKDPEIKQLLNIAREDVKKWSTQPSLAPSWQKLSDEEIAKIFDDIGISTTNRKIYLAIEQALKEKNHG